LLLRVIKREDFHPIFLEATSFLLLQRPKGEKKGEAINHELYYRQKHSLLDWRTLLPEPPLLLTHIPEQTLLLPANIPTVNI
jgi:hypothetical protein